MASIRWWLFKRLSVFGWWICPEPHKSRLQAAMPTWSELRAAADAASLDDAIARLRDALERERP